MFLKSRKFYTLLDIRKQLVFTPIIFVFIISFISIIVIVSILKFQKQNEIKLLLQESSFKKKSLLSEFVNDIKFNASSSFDKSETKLNNAVTEINGFIKNFEKNISLDDVKNIVQKYEQNSDLKFVLFNERDYELYYGKQTIDYLMKITNAKMSLEKFRHHMLKNIQYIGDSNLIYWIDKEKKKIQLSFFKSVNNRPLFIGAFSKVDDIKNSTKNSILDSIFQKSKYFKDSYFWFYDYDVGYVYNYYNKGQKIDVKYIFEKDRLNSSNEVLKKYKKYSTEVQLDSIYNFSKYNFLVSVKNDSLPVKISKLEFEYNSKLIISIAIVFLVALFLVVASMFFSKFINKIFHRYNKRLETKNIMYKKWKERYKLAIIASNDGLWDIDLRTNHIYFSKKWLEMFGYKDGDINNLDDWFDLIHKEDKSLVQSKLNEHLSGESEHFICEYRIKSKHNFYKWILVRGKAFYDKQNKRMLMMSMDIDHRKKLSKELQYVDLLVEYGRIVIFKWKYDEELTIQYLSKSIQSYGYEPKDFESKKIKYLDFVLDEDVNDLKKDIKKAIKNDDKSFTKIYRVKDRNGGIRWVSNRTIFLKDDFGNVTHLYGYINDITQMKLTEEQLKQKIVHEVAKNTEKDRILVHQSKLAAMGEMLENIAHQWRQPLNNINLLIYFIRDSYGTLSKEELDSIIKDTKIQIDYMSQTIDDFRNFYQPNKDKVQFDIKDSIMQSIKIVETQFEKSGLSINIEGVDAQTINYKNEFEQVIVNILNNANDAAILKKQKDEKFNPIINISLQKDEKEIRVVLSNNCGEVPLDIIDRIFEPYFTTKFENQGTGVGLYMAKTIIEKNMKGKISVTNIENGVSFIITLPL